MSTETAIAVTQRMKKAKVLSPVVEMSLDDGTDHMNQVIGFHHQYNNPMHPLGSQDRQFEHMTDERVALRLGLIMEEFKELLEDGFGVKTEITFLVPKTLTGPESIIHRPFNEDSFKDGNVMKAAREIGIDRSGADVADALGDLIYVIYGMALEIGYDLRKVVAEIHASNMTKLGRDGRPVLRSDGKVLKGPDYVKPNIPAALGWVD